MKSFFFLNFNSGLETKATYIPEREEFELETPTLTSTKWWSGTLGKKEKMKRKKKIKETKTLQEKPQHMLLWWQILFQKDTIMVFMDSFCKKKKKKVWWIYWNFFSSQIRSLKDHSPLPGITVGDIGPKVKHKNRATNIQNKQNTKTKIQFGMNAMDNGYLRLDKVRIPRKQMLMRFSRIEKDGTYVKATAVSDKLAYLGMVNKTKRKKERKEMKTTKK